MSFCCEIEWLRLTQMCNGTHHRNVLRAVYMNYILLYVKTTEVYLAQLIRQIRKETGLQKKTMR